MSMRKSEADRRIKPRFKISVKLRVQAQLIGSFNKFEFISIDISESGLLMKHASENLSSFNNLSILEVWLHPPNDEPIFFYAKFVRLSHDKQALAIRIADIEPKEFDRYVQFIQKYSDSEVPHV